MLHGDVIIASSFTNAGTVSVGAGARIDARGARGYSQTGGLTEGAGEIRALQGGVTVSGGKFIPGGPHSPGKLTVDGNYTQGSNANLIIDINGPGSGQFSVLDVLGETGGRQRTGRTRHRVLLRRRRRAGPFRGGQVARRPLPHVEEPNLPRRDRPQGQSVPGRTRSDRR